MKGAEIDHLSLFCIFLSWYIHILCVGVCTDCGMYSCNIIPSTHSPTYSITRYAHVYVCVYVHVCAWCAHVMASLKTLEMRTSPLLLYTNTPPIILHTCHVNTQNQISHPVYYKLYMYKGGHYIVIYTPTRDRSQDLDPSNFRP